MSKYKKYACYWLSVTKKDNKPNAVYYALMDLRKLENDQYILVSPKGRTINKFKLNGSEKIQERADREYIVSMGESSMEGFKVDVIMREGHEKCKMKKYYSNSKENLIRFSETCFPEYAEAISAAIEVFDYVDIQP